MNQLLISLLLILPLRADGPAWAWREALLKEEGIEDSPEAIRKALTAKAPPRAHFEKALKQLESLEFAERETAQKELQQGGEAVYQWLSRLEPSPEPEVRTRIRQILVSLGADQRQTRDEALRFALQSLLEEGDQREKDTGGRFYEWFGEDLPTVSKGYHLLDFARTVKRDGRVEKGRLRLAGNDRFDGDQRLVLKSQVWPGRDDFGDRFTVSARLGGEPKSAAAWHLGISIGKVRVLYHPGYRGGGFRFQKIEVAKPLSGSNSDMGFTPLEDPLQKMTVGVRRLPRGDVLLVVTVEQGGKDPKTFKSKIVVKAVDIGPLNQISLDRSGRNGGDAFFDDFSVTLEP